MTVAIRLSTGTVLVPLQLTAGETVDESPTVHAAAGFVVLEPGTTDFTVTGKTHTETTSRFKYFERIAAVAELPDTADETQMAQLRTQWENVDAFYRRVEDRTQTSHTPRRTLRLEQMRVLDVNVADMPTEAVGWTPNPEFLAIPAPLSALVPGTLAGVPERIADLLTDTGSRVRTCAPPPGQDEATVIVEFTVPFADARTRLVKLNPLSNRRGGKHVKVTDTKYVVSRTAVPAVLRADNLTAARRLADAFRWYDEHELTRVSD